MTELWGRELDRLLLDAVDVLVHDPDVQAPAGRVIARVARAKIRARELYRANGSELPPAEDYVALIIAMARQDLMGRVDPTGQLGDLIRRC
jgi:hypothetical protein